MYLPRKKGVPISSFAPYYRRRQSYIRQNLNCDGPSFWHVCKTSYTESGGEETQHGNFLPFAFSMATFSSKVTTWEQTLLKTRNSCNLEKNPHNWDIWKTLRNETFWTFLKIEKNGRKTELKVVNGIQTGLCIRRHKASMNSVTRIPKEKTLGAWRGPR